MTTSEVVLIIKALGAFCGALAAAYAVYRKVKFGDGSKIIDAQLQLEKVKMAKDAQEHAQATDIVGWMKDLLSAEKDERQALSKALREQSETFSTQIAALTTRSEECEADRDRMRKRIARIEDSISLDDFQPPSSGQPE